MSPCERCTRVENPQNCDFKRCRTWSHWWKRRWDRNCLKLYRKAHRAGRVEGRVDS